MSAHYSSSAQSVNLESPGSAPIQADRRRLEMCFKNLLENALKYGKKGSGVKIYLGKMDSGYKIEIANKDSDSANKNSGFGLGILLSESIVKAHRGDFKIAKTVDGTSVVIVIPQRN
jgi:two-component system, OmpR family, phosphate regulon sensor histidine kinase PhoR